MLVPKREVPIQFEVGLRWTPALVGGGWTPVSDFFLDHYRLLPRPITNQEAMLVIHLMRHKWGAAAPFPGFKRLAARMGISTASVRGHARSLERKGYLRRVGRVGTTNRFDLTPLFTALEDLQVRLAQEQKNRQDKSADGEPEETDGRLEGVL